MTNKIYARIERHVVVEIIAAAYDEQGREIAIADRFHTDIAVTMIDATDIAGIAPNWTYEAEVFNSPMAFKPTLNAVKAAKRLELTSAFTRAMSTIRAGYPPDEIQSWDEQKSEATAYLASNTAQTPLLASIAKERGIALPDLVARVLNNAADWSAVSGMLIGKRQKYQDAVDAAVHDDEVRVIIWVD